MSVTEKALNLEETAHLLNVTEATLRRLARTGAVPCFKVGIEWRFPADIVDQLIRSTQSDRGRKGGES